MSEAMPTTPALTDPTPGSPPAGVPPWLVALVRGLLEAAVLAVIGAAIVALGEVTAGDLAPWAPVGILALRSLEGIADQRIDPTRQRGTLGGTSVTPTPGNR